MLGEGVSYGAGLLERMLSAGELTLNGAILRSPPDADASRVPDQTTPLLYLLGANDRRADTRGRLALLRQWAEQRQEIYYRVYAHEGHDLRTRAAIEDAARASATFAQHVVQLTRD